MAGRSAALPVQATPSTVPHKSGNSSAPPLVILYFQEAGLLCTHSTGCCRDALLQGFSSKGRCASCTFLVARTQGKCAQLAELYAASGATTGSG